MVLQIPLSASFCLFKGIKTSSSTSATEILLFKTIRQRFQKTEILQSLLLGWSSKAATEVLELPCCAACGRSGCERIRKQLLTQHLG